MGRPARTGELPTLLPVARALLAHRRIRIRYQDAGGTAMDRVVSPLGLAFREEGWLLAAHCHLRRALRHFLVARILAVKPAPGRVAWHAAPAGFDARFFSAEGHLCPGSRAPALATVLLGHPLEAVAEGLLPAARVERPGRGLAVCHVLATDDAAMTRLVAGLGPAASLAGRPGEPPPWATTSLASTSPSARPLRVHCASAMPRASPEVRLLRLAAWFVAQGQPVTRKQVYESFPDDYAGSALAREKKFTRDKQDLEVLGVPVRHVAELGEAGAYVVDTGAAFLPGLEFSPQESVVVWLAGQSALRGHDHPLREDLGGALRKLVVGAKGLPPRAAPLEVDTPPPDPTALRKYLDVLAEALEKRHRMRLRYRRPDGEVTDRLFDLHGYAWRRGEWLLAGHCHLRQAPRVFYLRRVESMKLVPADPRKPDYQVPAGFDIRAWSRQQPWDYLVHPPRPVAVRFRGSLAAVAPKLLPGAKLTTEADNSRTARLEVRNLAGLVRQALAWGPEAELVEPEEGRALARRMLAALRQRLEALP